MWFPILIAALTAYLLGNLNGAVCVSSLIAHDDVREKGSGNAGLTNFIRSYGAGSALFVILIDAGKAVVACLAAGLILEPYGLALEGKVLGGMMVLLGHDFPALLGFKGGKGILSGWFVALTIDWRIGLMIFVVFAVFYLATQYVSLGSVLSAVTFAVGFTIFYHDNLPVMLAGFVMSTVVLYMHRGNIQRLLRHEERKTNLFSRRKAQ